MAGHHVAILGLGLIGASFGLALKQHSGTTVVGFDPNAEALRRAVERGAIDKSTASPHDAIRGADTVILAAPVRGILELLDQLARLLSAGTLVTDTGSTKATIVAHAEAALREGVGFVGGHPLAGRLRSRVDDADAGLFVGATYCLSPTEATAEWAIDRATQLVEAIGAVPHFVGPGEHDALLAAVSHLPYFASAALVSALGGQEGWPEMSSLAAGGFRTASSLVDGSPQIWADIALTNSGPLDRQLATLIEALTDLRSVVAARDSAALSQALERAYAIRRDWVQSQEASSPQVTEPSVPATPKRRFPFLR